MLHLLRNSVKKFSRNQIYSSTYSYKKVVFGSRIFVRFSGVGPKLKDPVRKITKSVVNNSSSEFQRPTISRESILEAKSKLKHVDLPANRTSSGGYSKQTTMSYEQLKAIPNPLAKKITPLPTLTKSPVVNDSETCTIPHYTTTIPNFSSISEIAPPLAVSPIPSSLPYYYTTVTRSTLSPLASSQNFGNYYFSSGLLSSIRRYQPFFSCSFPNIQKRNASSDQIKCLEDKYKFRVNKEDVGKSAEESHYVFSETEIEKIWGVTHAKGHKPTGSHLDQRNSIASATDIEGRSLTDINGCTQNVRAIDQKTPVRPLTNEEVAKLDPLSLERCYKLLHIKKKAPEVEIELQKMLFKIKTMGKLEKSLRLVYINSLIDITYEETKNK